MHNTNNVFRLPILYVPDNDDDDMVSGSRLIFFSTTFQ